MADVLNRLLTTLATRLHAFSVCGIQEGWRLAFAPLDAVVIHCVLRGTSGLRVGNGPWRPFAPHSILVVPPRRPHALGEPGTPAGEVRGEDHCSLLGDGLVAFTAGDGARDTLLACGTIPAAQGGALGLFNLLRDPVVEDVSSSGVHRQAFGLMLAEVMKRGLGTQAMTGTLMQQCLVSLLRRHLPGDGLDSPFSAALRDPRLMRAVVAVLEDPAAPHSVESLASLAGMGRASFADRFSRAFRQGPIDFVQKVRLSVAARLLATTDLPVKVVAGSVGYASRSHFSRAFQASYGTGPRTFRRGGGDAGRARGPADAPPMRGPGVRPEAGIDDAEAPRDRARASKEGAASSNADRAAKP